MATNRSLPNVEGIEQELSRLRKTLTGELGSVGAIAQRIDVVLAQIVDWMAAGKEHARYRKLFESSIIGLCIVDARGVVTEANDYCLRWLGYSRDDLSAGNLKWDALIAPEFRSHGRRWFAEVLRGAGSPLFEAQYIHRRGHAVWGRVGAALLERDVPATAIVYVLDTTADQQARAQLRASEERWRLFVESAEEGVWIIDAAGCTSYLNPKMAEMLGYSVDDVIGRPLFAFIDPDKRDAALALLRRRREGVRERHRFMFRRRDGSTVDTSLATSPIIESDGRYVGALALVTDITEQQRDQDVVKASEDRLKLALTASGQGLWDWNVAKDETYLSPGYWELSGYSEVEARPTFAWFQSIIHPDDRATVEATMREHLQGKTPESVVEYRMRKKSGEYLWIRGVGRVMARDANGAPLRMVGVIEDISERKRFEKEQRFLAEAGALFSSSLDYEHTLSTIAGLAVRDFADWCGIDLIDENEGLMRLKVVSADPTKADLCARLERLPPDRAQHHLIRAVISMRQPILLERVTIGDIEWYAQGPDHLDALLAIGAKSAIAVPIMRQDHTFGVLVFISSTPSRIYGDADLQFAKALADRAALALENARLYQASVTATQLRDQVLAVVAHDLRSPIGAIQLHAGMLQRPGSQSTDDVKKTGEDIRRAAARINRLIEDLLDVALIESGELSVERTQVSSRELVEDAVETNRVRATSYSLELRVDVASDTPAVWGDPHRLLQVFDNLISNAMKFTSAGGHITVRAASRGEAVVFSVADSGCGIAPENLPRVFDRFWKGVRADRRGAGLGLHIARGIVEAHGGHIWAESAVGQGTTFFFSIPKASATAERPHAPIH